MGDMLDEAILRESREGNIETIIERLSTFRESERTSLLRNCKSLLLDRNLCADEDKRVACVKVLVSLLPSSLDILERFLNMRKGKHAYEIHFTIFCFLDELGSVRLPTSVVECVLNAVSEYIHSVRSNTANAAWMAGDLLGDHWKTDETLNILLIAAQKARYVAGRCGALHGLEQRLRETEPNSAVEKTIVDVLQKVSRFDRSHRARLHASHALDTASGKLRSKA